MNIKTTPFGGEFVVLIRDLSGGSGAEPIERIRGFTSLEHANEFARRYVRDSIERCRARGMSAAQVLEAWFAFGEDAEVPGGWSSGAEIRAFAESPSRDAEQRNWRVLDPRRYDDVEDDA
jgi:hypothetical protein